MAILSTPKIVTSSTAAFNPYCPRSDRLVYALPLVAGSGSGLQNFGRGDTFNPGYPSDLDGGASIGGTPSWVTSGVEAPYVQCGVGGCWIQAYVASAEVELFAWTVLIRFKLPTETPDEFPLVMQHGSGLDRLKIQLSIEGNPGVITVMHWVGGVEHTLLFAEVDTSEWQTLVIRGGPRGLKGWRLGGGDPEEDATDTGAWVIENGDTLLVGGLGGDGQSVGVRDFAFWDVELEDREVERVLSDSSLYSRPIPDKEDAFSTCAGAVVGRVTTGGATLRMVLGLGEEGVEELPSPASNIGWKANYSDRFGGALATVGPSYASAVGDVSQPLDLVITGLDPDTTHYYRAWWTVDGGTTWHPVPQGLQRFKTLASQGATGAGPSILVGVGSDSHNGAGVVDPHGFGGAVVTSTQVLDAWELAKTVLEGRVALATNEVGRDMDLRTEPGLVFLLGDEFYTDTPNTAGQEDWRWAKAKKASDVGDQLWQLQAAAGGCRGIGNHDGEEGFLQNSNLGTDVACQKQGTLIRKRYFPNPTDSTYEEGGENEGDPSIDDELSWLPGNVEPFSSYPGGYAGYLGDYVIDAGGENASPLQNYYALTSGSALLVMLDVGRYQEPGDPGEAIGAGGQHWRTSATGQLGAPQWAWLEGVLRGSRARFKIVIEHSRIGGQSIGVIGRPGSYYKRGQGVWVPTAEDRRLHRLLVETGVTLVVGGHDHRFSIGWANGVCYVTAPTMAGVQCYGSGWHGDDGWTALEDSYGSAFSRGADPHTGEAGSLREVGVKDTIQAMGYLLLEVTGQRLTVKLRQATCTRTDQGGGAGLVETPIYTMERLVADQASTPVSEVVDVGERPVDVPYAADDDDLTDGWWDAPPTNEKPSADQGPYGQEESYGGTEVTLNGTGDDGTQVWNVPRELISYGMVPRGLAHGGRSQPRKDGWGMGGRGGAGAAGWHRRRRGRAAQWVARRTTVALGGR